MFNNGAAVADAVTGEIFFKIGIPPQHYKQLVKAAAEFDGIVQSWGHDTIAIYGPSLVGRQRHTPARSEKEPALCEERVYDDIDEMDRNCRDTAQKILIGIDCNLLPKVAQALERICKVEVTTPFSTMLDITMPGATKRTGAEKLAAYYGIEPRSIMAIGDNENDLPMLDYAGVKVCVQNGTENIKRKAQHIVGKNTEGGFAQAVYELALQ